MTLLPLPEAPRIVVVSPRRSSRLRSVKMIFGPKRFFTWEKRMITSPMGVRASADSTAAETGADDAVIVPGILRLATGRSEPRHAIRQR